MRNYAAKLFLTAIFAFVFANVNTFAAEVEEASYKSNMTCNGCKTAIEKELNKTDGVEQVNADVESNVVKVTYNPTKTNSESIQKVIKKTGFKADAVKSCEGKSKECCDGKKKASAKKEGECCEDKKAKI